MHPCQVQERPDQNIHESANFFVVFLHEKAIFDETYNIFLIYAITIKNKFQFIEQNNKTNADGFSVGVNICLLRIGF